MRILKLTKLFKLEYVNKLLWYYNSFVIIKLWMNVINIWCFNINCIFVYL
jgi:hypothetical protein